MKLKTNIVYFRFWDHAHWSGSKAKPIECEITGVIVGEDDIAYSVAVWIADRRIDDNAEIFVVVKGAIIEMRRLHIGPKLKLPRRRQQ